MKHLPSPTTLDQQTEHIPNQKTRPENNSSLSGNLRLEPENFLQDYDICENQGLFPIKFHFCNKNSDNLYHHIIFATK